MRTSVLASTIGTTLFLCQAAVPVSAEQPIHLTQSFDFTVLATNTSATCGFDVYRRIVGTFTITALRTHGSVVREIDGAHKATSIWFAPSQGTSYSFPLNAPVRYDYPEGGTVGAPAMLTLTGLNEKVPGKPASAGQAVYEGVVADVGSDGIPLVITDPEPVKITGSVGASVQDRCDALVAE